MRELGDTKTPTKKHVEQFKVKSDEYLSKIVDKPGGPTSNSLLSQKQSQQSKVSFLTCCYSISNI